MRSRKETNREKEAKTGHTIIFQDRDDLDEFYHTPNKFT